MTLNDLETITTVPKRMKISQYY